MHKPVKVQTGDHHSDRPAVQPCALVDGLHWHGNGNQAPSADRSRGLHDRENQQLALARSPSRSWTIRFPGGSGSITIGAPGQARTISGFGSAV